MYEITGITRLETSLLDCYNDDLTAGQLIDQAIINFPEDLFYEQVVQAWNKIMPWFDAGIAGCADSESYQDILEAHNKIKQFQQDLFSKPDSEQQMNSLIAQNKEKIA